MGLQCGSICNGKYLKGHDTLTLVQLIHLIQKKKRATNCEQHGLIFEMSCDKEAILPKIIPDAALVYKILQEKLTVKTNLQQSTITAILATDPSNSRFWRVMFHSTATKKFTKLGMRRLQKILRGLPTRIGNGQRVLLSISS